MSTEENPPPKQLHPQGTLSPHGDTWTQPRRGTQRAAAVFFERVDTWTSPGGTNYAIQVRCFSEHDESPMALNSEPGCPFCLAEIRHSERYCAFLRSSTAYLEDIG